MDLTYERKTFLLYCKSDFGFVPWTILMCCKLDYGISLIWCYSINHCYDLLANICTRALHPIIMLDL